jgi:hypothetical protein
MSVSSSSFGSARRPAALFAGALVVALLFAGAARDDAGAAMPMAMTMTSTAKVVAIHEAMDKLWTDHVTWTRIVIADFAANAPDLKPDLARLLRNQVDIGNAIKPYYGAAAGNKLTRLLHTHIMEAVPVLTYAKDGDKAKLAGAMNAWQANARRIAVFLSTANPRAWPLAATSSMMATHLALTANEATAHLEHRWAADIAAYDQVRNEILMMADTLANGIVAQFPSRFAA